MAAMMGEGLHMIDCQVPAQTPLLAQLTGNIVAPENTPLLGRLSWERMN